MERITNKYVFFWGSEFSNWYPVIFNYKNLRFANSEQAFMYEKALFFGDNESAEMILKSKSPSTAKSLGRRIKNYNDAKWAEVRYEFMVDVVLAKFEQNPSLKEALLSTGNRTIVEASPEDRIWGIGMHWTDEGVLDEKNWKGLNLLGKALMDVREKLR
jgi:ribA/ribD-fused uncharacterized protein